MGTDESWWAGWPYLDSLPAVEAPAGRIIVVSAHPDDEVLGAGGVLAAVAGSESSSIAFVTVSDGEASHPGMSADGERDLGARRALELRDALGCLGYPDPEITRMHLPDSGLAAHVNELADRLEPLVRGADLVLCPARTDGHIDHATVGRVTAEVCAGGVDVWEFPIWIWHWTTPPDEPDAPWERARRLDLSPEIVQRKRQALACFASQVAAVPGDPSGDVILPAEVIEHFTRPYEVFFT